MLAKVTSAALVGLEALPIEVEVDIASQGLPSFTIVGLPDKAVEESRERVRSAIKNIGADFPSKRITVNLAPADLPKEGPFYDLPIALGILAASAQITPDLSDSLFIGELSLDGKLRHVNGVLSIVLMAKEKGIKKVFLPETDALEASIIKDVEIFSISSLIDLLNHFTNKKLVTPVTGKKLNDFIEVVSFEYDMQEIKGQEKVKRAMEIAAAGAHNILLKGPPGAGKTLIAKTLPSIMPKLSLMEALEVTKIYSISGLLQGSIKISRPFRNPHHTTSHVGLIGGSANPKPGEVSLSHRGVLFLDELPEFPRQVLESLRQPIEDGVVSVSRANGKVTFPAKFMLVAAQNPCPCGYYGDTTHSCTCAASQILRYQKKISGPLLDRIDIHVEVPAVKVDKLTEENLTKSESSLQIRKRVQKARDKQQTRFIDKKITSNSEMGNKEIKEFCNLGKAEIAFAKQAIDKMKLSARSYFRLLKVARTIADLEGSDEIKLNHMAEALQFRSKSNII